MSKAAQVTSLDVSTTLVALEVCATIQDEQQAGDGAESMRRVSAALHEMRTDAARWRFVRDARAEIDWSDPNTWRVVVTGRSGIAIGYRAATVDEAIDKAMAVHARPAREVSA